MKTFRALRTYNESGRVVARVEELSLADLSPGEVLIRAAYSSINYKDALACTGRAPSPSRHPGLCLRKP